MNATGGVPELVRVKPGALGRLGLYLRRDDRRQAVVLMSEGLPEALTRAVREGVEAEAATELVWSEVTEGSFEAAAELFEGLARPADAVIGLGGGKALDVAKYVAFLGGRPYYAVPTSLSNDGLCSPQSSLTMKGRRRSLPSVMPYGVVVDTEACLGAPRVLWHSGVGDLAAKLTAVHDWKLAFHRRGTPVNDFAALLSDATVMQFIARPAYDLEGMRLLATALMLNGIAMHWAGSSRPASGSEHLVSHALDLRSSRPRLHGLQVGVATYIVSRLQAAGREGEDAPEADTDLVRGLFERTGFWSAIERDPFDRDEWLAAFELAPTLKEDFYTVLSERDVRPEVEAMLADDPHLARCFAR